jgi:hypothetical protein
MRENEIRADLRTLAHFLDNWDKNVKNASLLNQIKVTSTPLISYSISTSQPLIFSNIDIDRHSIPTGIDSIPKDDRLFNVHINILFAEEVKLTSELYDPISKLGVAFKIKGEYIKGEEIKKAMCSWHLDKTTSSGSSFHHPTYHLNFGGDHMIDEVKLNNDCFGNLLLLPNPRVIHPPMDIILSCDFVIKNFYTKSRHQKLTQSNGYIRLIEKARKRYWESFVYALISNWDTTFTVSNLEFENVIGNR